MEILVIIGAIIWIGNWLHDTYTNPLYQDKVCSPVVELSDQEILNRKCHEYLTTNHW